MMRYALFAAVFASSAVFAGGAKKNVGQSSTDNSAQQGQTMAPADCSQMTPDEQNFSAKLTDPNNKQMFCSQFTPQQRQQAMQMMGKPDASGNMMSADQCVQQVMAAPPAQTKPKGGCPVK